MTSPKRALRSRMLAARAALSTAEIARRSAALCTQLEAVSELRNARGVAGYGAFRHEIDPAACLAALRAGGTRIALPRIGTDGELQLRMPTGGSPALGAFGQPEPAVDDPLMALEAVDVILVPAVAVDLAGERLGFGRGFYDRLLARMPHALKVAVVYDFQVVEHVAAEPHDVRVDRVVTETRCIRTG